MQSLQQPTPWEIIASIAGACAFVLSVAHWIYELCKMRTRLSIVDAYYSHAYDGRAGRAYLEFIVTNRSSVPTSITSVALIDCYDHERPMETRPTNVMTMSNKYKEQRRAHYNLATSKLPILLQPQESTAIFLCIHLHNALPQSLRFPLVDTPAPPFQRYIDGHSEPNIAAPPWPVRAIVRTSRRPVRFRFAATFRPMSYYEDLAFEALNFAENQV